MFHLEVGQDVFGILEVAESKPGAIFNVWIAQPLHKPLGGPVEYLVVNDLLNFILILAINKEWWWWWG